MKSFRDTLYETVKGIAETILLIIAFGYMLLTIPFVFLSYGILFGVIWHGTHWIIAIMCFVLLLASAKHIVGNKDALRLIVLCWPLALALGFGIASFLGVDEEFLKGV